MNIDSPKFVSDHSRDNFRLRHKQARGCHFSLVGLCLSCNWAPMGEHVPIEITGRIKKSSQGWSFCQHRASNTQKSTENRTPRAEKDGRRPPHIRVCNRGSCGKNLFLTHIIPQTCFPEMAGVDMENCFWSVLKCRQQHLCMPAS